jgi:hypothetical protein
LLLLVIILGGLSLLGSTPKSELSTCNYTDSQPEPNCPFSINSIPIVNLWIDTPKDEIVKEYVKGLTVTITDDKIENNNYSGLTGKIKARGTSTYLIGKKYGPMPYKIKLDEKANIFGFGENKSWVLLPNFIDPTHLRQFYSFYFAQEIMGENYFQPDAKYVELYLNNDYQGLYLLVESIEENENRLNVEKFYQEDKDSTPFVVEIDFNGEVINSDTRFLVDDLTMSGDNAENGAGNIPYELNYPENFSDVSEAQAKYIKNTIQNLYQNTKDQKPLSELGIDLESFVNFFLFNEIYRNVHFGEASTYFYSDGNTLFAGPLWDFDMSFAYDSPQGFLNPVKYDNALYRYLLQYPEFKDAMKKRFNEFYQNTAPTLNNALDYLKNNDLLKAAVDRNEEKYHRNSRTDTREEWFIQQPNRNVGDINSFEKHADYIKGWLFDGLYLRDGGEWYDSSPAWWYDGRMEWLKNHIDEL